MQATSRLLHAGFGEEPRCDVFAEAAPKPTCRSMELLDSMALVSCRVQYSESGADTASQSKSWRPTLVSLEDGQDFIRESQCNNYANNNAGSHSG